MKSMMTVRNIECASDKFNVVEIMHKNVSKFYN